MTTLKPFIGTAKNALLSLLFCLLATPNLGLACTTVSAIARNGHVWTANNEDGPFGVANFINVYPRSGMDKYGYYTMTYLSPRYGQSGAIQGGMNEAGLSFDFDAIPYVEAFDPESRKAFPQGNDAILPYILGNMETVEQVITFFETYWFVDGFREAQMHVSDKNGSFAIVSASGVELAEKGEFLVSTNFDISGKGDDSSCWRYPLAIKILSNSGAGLETMQAICRETAQKNGATMYSNVQNLSTGEIWFFSKHDPGTLLHTNISAMLSNGPKSYSFNDLKSLQEKRPQHRWQVPEHIEFDEKNVTDYLGTYEHFFIGPVLVAKVAEGIEVSFADGTKETLYPDSKGNFSLPDYDLYVTFGMDKSSEIPQMSLYENGFWSFTVQLPDALEQNSESRR